jgi:hypothetical protein
VNTKRIRIAWPSGELTALLHDTPNASALLAALPLASSANLWGEELYVFAPLNVNLEADARQVVEPGSICFWVEGNSLAVPFGLCPVSLGDERRAVTKANLLGHIDGDCRLLRSLKDGDKIHIESAD